MQRLWIYLFLAIGTLPAFGDYGTSSNSASVGAGYLSHNAGTAATNASTGKKPIMAETYSQISLNAKFAIDENWSISPLLLLAYPNKKSAENKETTTVDYLTIKTNRNFGYGIDGHFGLGVLYYQIKGEGGTVDLPNGSGTSTFGIPSQTRTSSLIAWDFGTAYQYEIYRAELSLIFTEIMSNTRRAVSPVITFSIEVL